MRSPPSFPPFATEINGEISMRLARQFPSAVVRLSLFGLWASRFTPGIFALSKQGAHTAHCL